jgi:DNA-directed RNA polymerase subunit K/omega
MPKKPQTKKSSKKDEETEEYEMNEDIEEVEVSDFDEDEDEEEDDEEKEDMVIEQDGDDNGNCAIEDALEDDDEYYNNVVETEIPEESHSDFLNKEQRISSNRMTKYEMVRILGERTKQLTMGAKPMIKNYQGLSYETIAEEEFKRNMIPFKVKRPLPNGKFEIWAMEELFKEHLLSLL